MISRRTKSALSAAKAKGVRLETRKLPGAQGIDRRTHQSADDFPAGILPVIAEIQATRATTLRDIADALNSTRLQDAPWRRMVRHERQERSRARSLANPRSRARSWGPQAGRERL